MRNTQSSAGDGPISRQATEWFVRLDAGALSEDERRSFERWMADPAHRAAFEEVRGLWGDLAEIDRSAHARKRGRAAALAAALAASLAVAAAAAFALDIPMRLQADALTATGETLGVALPDGSRAVLNTASAMAIDFTEGSRQVRLLRGEASFAVARDDGRPFNVGVEGGSVRALGTEFAVRRIGEDVLVTDIESHVTVSYPAGAGAGVELAPGEQVRFGPQIGLGAVQKVDADAETAWRRGKLVFVDRPLGDVIDELNRYHRGAIRIVDSTIYARRVSGVFETRDPVTIVDAIQASLGLRSTRLTDYVILLHR